MFVKQWERLRRTSRLDNYTIYENPTLEYSFITSNENQGHR